MEAKKWDIYNYHATRVLLAECKLNVEHRIVDGKRGSGKSFAARSFVEDVDAGEILPDLPKGETFVVTAAEDMNPKAFMVEMARAMRIDASGDRLSIRKKIAAALRGMQHPLIAIDEAENLRMSTYGSIKALYDEVFEYCSIVLIGANDYLDTLKKWSEKGRGCIPQVYSRFSCDPVSLLAMSKEDAERICRQSGIVDMRTIGRIFAKSIDYRQLDRNIKRELRDRNLGKGHEDND